MVRIECRTWTPPADRAVPSPIGTAPPRVIPTPRIIPAGAIMPTAVIPRVVGVCPPRIAWCRPCPIVIIHTPHIAIADVPIVRTAHNDARAWAVEAHHHLCTRIVNLIIIVSDRRINIFDRARD